MDGDPFSNMADNVATPQEPDRLFDVQKSRLVMYARQVWVSAIRIHIAIKAALAKPRRRSFVVLPEGA